MDYLRPVAIMAVVAIGGAAVVYRNNLLPTVVASSISKLSATVSDPDKLGWLDDAILTDSDRSRITQITGVGQSSNISVIHNIQAGSRGNVTRRDFELLRQDRRRAQAAYPDVPEDDLHRGTWINVDLDARVPDDFCRGNSNGTKVGDRWYLDGGCHVSVVKPEYTNRADAATTRRVLADLKDTSRQKRLSHLRRWGYDTSWGGTGGSGRVGCYPTPLPSNEEADDLHVAGQCVVILDEKTKYVFPYDPTDWVDPPYWPAALTKLALSKGAVASDYVRTPEKPWVLIDGSLARGQTGTAGRLYRSMWNADKDDYDNTDIGPSDPASWVANGIFGAVLGFVPAPDNGEKRSDPNKLWYLAISYYGYPTQISGGWTEAEAKGALPKFSTGMTYPLDGRDFASVNRGNLREARATQAEPTNGQILKDRTLPVKPAPDPPSANYVPYSPGMTLGPGQTTSIGMR